MKFDFDTPIDRGGTWSTRWDRYAGRDIVPLWVADTDFRPPPAVLDALSARIAHGIRLAGIAAGEAYFGTTGTVSAKAARSISLR